MLKIQIQKANFIHYCHTHRRLSDLTIRVYQMDLTRFLKFLSAQNPPVTKVRHVDKCLLDKYLSDLSLHYQPKTIKRHLACLRSFFRYLEYEDEICVNPFDRFQCNIKEAHKIPTSLELSELERILQAAYREQALHERNHFSDPYPLSPASIDFICTRDIAVLELLFASGLRVNELCSITYAQMQNDFTTLTVCGKGNKEREIFIGHTQVMRALRAYASLREYTHSTCPAFFINKFNKPLSTQAVRNLVTKYTSLAGLHKHVTPHAFRHSFASLLLEEDVSIKYIQEYLGHSSISTTQLYLHTSNAKRNAVLRASHPRKKLNI